jgi:hypothetical protein
VQFEEWPFFALTQLINTVEGPTVTFLGGSPKFIHFLKDKCGGYQGSLNKKKVWYTQNRSYEIYSLEISLFKKLALEFYSLQRTWFDAWAKLSNLRKLVFLLEFIFDRNKLAHGNGQRGRRRRQFEKKSKVLENAIEYAKSIHGDLPFFDYGKQYDATPNYPSIIYFQFGDLQISFHSDLEDVKVFPGKWNGIINEDCPVNLREVLHLMIKHNINETKLAAATREEIYQLDDRILTEKLEQHRKMPPEVIIEPKISPSLGVRETSIPEKRLKTLVSFIKKPERNP